jgi:uncharacterized membrane protein
MKKFTIILFLVAAALIGYAMFYLGLAFFKALLGLGVLILIIVGGYIGYMLGKKTKKPSEK